MLLGCGSKESNDTSVVDNTIPLNGKKELREALEQSTVTCMESSCPSNVAKLVFWQEDEFSDEQINFGVCSGTLIDEDTIVTNSHCIPSEISYDGASCYGQIVVQFPEADGLREAENVDCMTVKKVNDHLSGAPDLAIIKVGASRYNRQRTTVQPNHMLNAKKIYSYTMNPGQYSYNQFSGYLYKKSCNVSTHSILTGEIKRYSSDALIYGYDCDVISGNSGSGVFSDSGNLIGVIHSRIDKNEVMSQFRSNGINVGYLKYMGLFVNIGCLDEYGVPARSGNCVSSTIDNNVQLRDYLNSVKRKSPLRNLDDEDIKAVIGEGLGVELSRYPTSGILRRFDSLKKMKEKLFDYNASEENAWATVKK